MNQKDTTPGMFFLNLDSVMPVTDCEMFSFVFDAGVIRSKYALSICIYLLKNECPLHVQLVERLSFHFRQDVNGFFERGVLFQFVVPCFAL